MYITTDIIDFNIKNVFLHEPVKNILKTGCEFMKVIYSNTLFVMNGLYVDVAFKNIEVQKRKDTYKMKVDKIQNKEILDTISNIEKDLLDLLPSGLSKIYSLRSDYDKMRQLKKYGDIELTSGIHNDLTCTLRIFGVWMDSSRCGLNYQFVVT
tara:strand:- start:376 stop:834 length:459 start_codon:yes stop_codon:yes gene_type:complete